MKKITLIMLLLCSFATLFAQAPQKMSYQSVIRKTDGTLVVNKLVSIKISILQGSATGTAVYIETQTTTTNANGLATITIGGGIPVTGAFAGIDWSSGNYFVKTETDPNGGTSYTISGTSQLLSVPYALYAENNRNIGKTTIFLCGDITNEQAAIQIAAEAGPNTENVSILNTTGLTTVDLSAITRLISLSIVDNENLVSVNLDNLKVIYRVLNISSNKSIVSLSFPSLIKAANDSSNLDMQAYSQIYFNNSLISVDFPLLTSFGNLGINRNSKLSFVGLPSLTNFKVFKLTQNAFPSIVINTLLHKFLTVAPASGKDIGLDSQTPPAPPTGQGITDKATLINTGNSVSTD